MLMLFFSLSVIITITYAYFLTRTVNLRVITNLVTNYNIETLINKSSLLDTKLEQYDLLLNEITTNQEYRDILQIQDPDSYQSAVAVGKFGNDTANIAIQLQTEYLCSIVLRSPYQAFFSPTDTQYLGNTKNGTDIGDYANSLYKQLERNQGRLTFIKTDDYRFNLNKDYQCFVMGRMINRLDSKELGYAMLFIKYDFFKNVLDDLSTDNNSSLCILDANNDVMYSYRESDTDIRNLQALFGDLPGNGNYKIIKDAQGRSTLVSYYRSSYTGWTILKSTPLSSVLNGIQMNNTLTVLFCMIFVILAIILANYISATISKPIKNIIGTMRGISAGDMSLRAKTYESSEVRELGLHFNNMLGKINKLIEENDEKQREMIQIELSMLQMQINPHFLYNTLSSVRWISMMNKQDQITKIIESLSKLIMNTYKKIGTTITVEEELSIVEDYVAIMKIRYSNFNLKVDCSAELLSYRIPKLLLQPFIENAIIHGFSKINVMGQIQISFKKDKDALLIRIADNGTGMDETMKKTILEQNVNDDSGFNGIGIGNVNRRIKLHYGDAYGISILDNEPNGTIIEIRLAAGL
jgi:two-component system sensor histidine kinase YesM